MIRIETWSKLRYDEIMEEYGEVLSKYGVVDRDDRPYINIKTFDELAQLNKDLHDFSDERDMDWYFGLLIQYEYGETYINIKDMAD